MCIALLATPAICATQDEKLQPTEAVKLISDKLQAMIKAKTITSNDEYYPKQKELTLEYLAQVQTSNLPASEEMAYAALLEQADMNDRATTIYQKLAKSDKSEAKAASKKLLDAEWQIFFSGNDESKKNPARFEKMIIEYRTRFSPTPDDIYGIYQHVGALADYYAEHGKPEEAIRIINDEIASLNYEAPYYSYMLIGRYRPYLDLDRREEAKANIIAGIKKFEDIIERRNTEKPENEPKHGTYDRTTAGYSGIAKTLNASLTKMNLTNAPAPGFNFTHFFNTEKFDFAERIKGKVVFLDFFANWCGPCIGTFPEMRQFYADYTPKGVVVIGITGFQGSMANHGADRVTGISKEEEVELMKQFIKHQNVIWPVVFSDRNCYDPAYGVMGVPTAVIIDKKGRIRMFTHPYYEEKNRAMIDTLLAEK